MRWLIIGMAGMALAGCVRNAAPGPDTPPPIPIESDSITYATGACFGACPVFTVTVRPDGSGTFIGTRFTAVTGQRNFQFPPAQFQEFQRRLAPYRPASGERRYSPGEPGCKQVATDMPSVDIRWTRAIGDSQSLYYYYGCEMEKNRAMAEALGNATDAIPALEALIGERP